MSDATTNALEVTVTELSNELKRTVEDRFGNVRVRGEIGRVSRPASGHIYLDLKDEKSNLAAVIWRGQVSRLKHPPEEGLEVIASGKLTTFPGQSKYQIIIDDIEPAGAGALMALLEERRKKLTAEGLFAEERKQLIPFMPRVIGVVTSPTGAVIRDILHRIADRFPVHVLVWPVRVQGETSAAEVANGVRQFNAIDGTGALPRPDVIIVARGGGSLEDLWGFNEEVAVRAVADSDLPVISAIGHETDWTLIDMAADYRAPTPTAAAEKAVPVKADLEALVADLGARLRGAMRRLLDRARQDVRGAARGLKTPDTLLATPRQRFDTATRALDVALERRVNEAGQKFGRVRDRLNAGVLVRQVKERRERFERVSRDSGIALARSVERRRQMFDRLSVQVTGKALETRVERARLRLAPLDNGLRRGFVRKVEDARVRLDRSGRMLHSLSYKAVLQRGYALVRHADGTPVMQAADVPAGAALSIEMRDGRFSAIATDAPGRKTAEKKPAAAAKGGQGDLF